MLFYGILGAIIFRAIFVALGSALMQYHWVVVFFGVFLIFTGIKIFIGKEKPPDPEKNLLIRLLTSNISRESRAGRFAFLYQAIRPAPRDSFVRGLVFLEATDIVFAVDSVPAIFAFTSEPLIVFTSNIFAILGLRALTSCWQPRSRSSTC